MEFCGKDREGRKLVKFGFRNMVNGEFHCDPEKGWEGEPPYPTGEVAGLNTNLSLYAQNFDQIRWYRDGETGWQVD